MLTTIEIKKFYDNLGARQDWQAFYENRAIARLIQHGEFKKAESVFEFGCGTGKFARALLEGHLSENCEYLGIDLSETMSDLTREKLNPFKDRAAVRLSNGTTELPFPDKSFDRFVSNYVLDILSEGEIMQIFSEAKRTLRENGLLCLTSLTCGENFLTRPISNFWQFVYEKNAKLVGGCRPLNLLVFLDEKSWQTKHHSKITSFGITSEIMIAKIL